MPQVDIYLELQGTGKRRKRDIVGLVENDASVGFMPTSNSTNSIFVVQVSQTSQLFCVLNRKY